MNGIDRRRVVFGTASLVAALSVPGPLLAAGPRPALFVFDSRLARSRAIAEAHRAAGVAVMDREVLDLGQAWHGRIPQILAARGGAVVGVTLWVDSYICETFGRERGLAMYRDATVRGDGLHAWALA
jgi:hypothetical protein